jgi:hypothetical protein
MPTPISIAQVVELGHRGASFRVAAYDFLHDQRARDAAPPGRPRRLLDRHVVVGNDRRDVPTRKIGGHLEIHHVAFVVLDDEDATAAGFDGPNSRDHLVRGWRREHLAGAGGVEHAVADETGMQRLVA